MTRIFSVIVVALAATGLVWGLLALRSSSPVSDRPPVEIGASPTTTTPPPTSPSTSAPATTTTTQPTPQEAASVDPIFDFVVQSGAFEDVGVLDSGPRPVRITIDDIDITAPIDPVGYVAETNEMEVPTRHDLVGWYQYSPTPGSPEGSSVLAAHVDYNGRKGVFFDLGEVKEGAIVTVDFEDGSRRLFEVVSGRQYDKDELPVEDIFSKTGDPVLTLITCGGAFDRSARSYEDNVVVYAIPIESGLGGS